MRPKITDCSFENSPRLYARIGGLLYLIIIVFGAFAEGFVNTKLIVSGDAAATAHNILANQPLWRLSLAGNMIVVLCAVPLMVISYALLRPVGRNLVLFSMFFNLISLAIEAVSKLYLLDVLPFLQGGDYLKAVAPEQLQVLAYHALKMHDAAWDIALLFFGFACLSDGLLIFRSNFFPKILGVLMQIAGFSYLTACWASLFAPTLAGVIFPVILLPALIGESSFCLWLLVKGVNVPKWQVRAGVGQLAAATVSI